MGGKLNGAERDRALAGLDGWTVAQDRDAIVKSFAFDDFASAFAFMTEVAAHADAVDHHPEWLNVYNRVDVTLASHDVGGITQRDVDMALFMDRAAGRSGPRAR